MALAKRTEDRVLETYGLKKDESIEGTFFDYLPLTPIKTEEMNNRSLRIVDKLMFMSEDNPEEFNRLTMDGSYLAELAKKIEEFEAEKYPIPDVGGVGVLKFLMEQNSLTQEALADAVFGGHQGNLSAILNEKNSRGLSKVAIKKLSEYFNISANVFL